MDAKSPLLLVTCATLTLAGCSADKQNEESAASVGQSPSRPADSAAMQSSNAGPEIDGAVTPGVAFTYSYSFSLPAKAISTIQREHAAACERLGIARCRVTGLDYQQPEEDEVSAHLAFLLAPDIAHRFASEGIAAVERADGKLENASVNGEDAGGAIILSQQNSAAVAGEVARLEGRLKTKGLGDGERRDLESRLSELRGQLRSEERLRRDKEASLATTPVSFSYASQGVFGSDAGFSRALAVSWNGIESALGFLLLLVGVLLPWLGLAGAGILIWRWLRQRNPSPVGPAPAP